MRRRLALKTMPGAEEKMTALARLTVGLVFIGTGWGKLHSIPDVTAFFTLKGPGEPGALIEVDTTQKIFTNPTEKRTEDYITGRFG